jgi:endogenous inhibitor of DNA gyrase (YacG/DUF329 family)
MTTTANQSVKIVACPQCGGDSIFAASNVYRPFCSDRCKNIDYGAWASERFRMPADAPPDDQVYGDAKLQ